MVKRNQDGITPHWHDHLNENSQFLETEKKDKLRIPIAEPAQSRSKSSARQFAAAEAIRDIHDQKNRGKNSEVRGDMQCGVRNILEKNNHERAAERQIEKRDPLESAARFEEFARKRPRSDERALDALE